MAIKKKSVLVIDDDPDFCLLIKTILEAKGMDVISAASIIGGKKILETELPNVIILDMELQNEFGTEFLKQRSTNLIWSKIPVIVCSSQNLSSVVKAAIRFGADDYLLKPIKQTWLIQRIRKILMREEALSFFFKAEEEVEVIIDARPISVSKTSFIGRSSIGFEKGAIVSVSILQPNEAPIKTDFKSEEKSRYNSRGPFDTLFSTVEVTENEKNRIQMMKNFWRFE